MVDAQVELFRRRGLDVSKMIHISKPNNEEFPVAGPAMFRDLVLICNTTAYRVLLEIDHQSIIDDTFDTLKDKSADLNNIAAYEDSGQAIVSAGNAYSYPVREQVDLRVGPTDAQTTITFPLQRAEVHIEDASLTTTGRI